MDNDKVAVLLEDLKSQFRIFGESLDLSNEKLDKVIEDVDYLKKKDIEKQVMLISLREDMNFVKKEQQEMKKEQQEMKKEQQEMRKEQGEMKNDIAVIKKDLKEVKKNVKLIDQKIIIHDKKLRKV
jgi:septal ring factor EnvC (AmiA/AmiB activator)